MSFDLFDGEQFVVLEYGQINQVIPSVVGDFFTVANLQRVLNTLEPWCNDYGYTLLNIERAGDTLLFIFRRGHTYHSLKALYGKSEN